MNATKSYTAIFVSDMDTRAVNINAHCNRDVAYENVYRSECMPGESLVALVPGTHAAWSHTFKDKRRKAAYRLRYTTGVDPFELPTNDSENRERTMTMPHDDVSDSFDYQEWVNQVQKENNNGNT